MFGFQETASYNFHQVPIEDFQQAKVSDFLVLSVSSIIDKRFEKFYEFDIHCSLDLNFSSWKIMLGIDIALSIFHQDHDVLLVSYADNGSGVWTYGDVVENKYVFLNVHPHLFTPSHIYLKPSDIVSYCLFF